MATDFPIITKLGGRKRVRELLAQAGHPRNHETLKQWTWRRRMPGDIQVALMAVAATEGIEVGYADFAVVPHESDAVLRCHGSTLRVA